MAQTASAQAQPQAAPARMAAPNVSATLIIRLRGTQNLNPKTKDTLRYMRLNRVNHAVVLPASDTTKGMLQVAKDYVTWGELDANTLAAIIRARGRVVGDKPVTDEYVAQTAVELGITYLFAPRFNPGLRHVSAVRRELATPTVFNLLGPMANPARPTGQVVGVKVRER